MALPNISRYNTTKTISTYTGKQALLTTYYPEINPTQDFIYVIASVSDRLDSLAYKYYGNSTLWWIIARANNLGKGGFSIPAGTQLVIPSPNSVLQIAQQLNQINS